MTTDIQSYGFGSGFSKEVTAILEVADRGLLYPQEIRENLQKAGFIIYDRIEMPDVPVPTVSPAFTYEEIPADEVGLDDDEEHES